MSAGTGSRPEPLLRLRGVRKVFDRGVAAVAGIDLDVHEGEFVTLLGPSGSGKTTTLRMVGGFEQSTAGEISLEGRRIDGDPPNRRPINTVFQDYALFPHLSVAENVAFGPRTVGHGAERTATEVTEALEMVGIAELHDRAPAKLSGGQRQRVALARALVMKPRVLLLDEPLGALDLALRRRMQLVLVRLCQQSKIAFLYVTHDQEEALTMSDRIAVMNAGRIEQVGTPESIYRDPATRFVAGFVGESNFLEGRCSECDGSKAVVEIEGALVEVAVNGHPSPRPGDPATVAARAEHLAVHRREQPLVGEIGATIVQVVFAGTGYQLAMETDGGSAVAARIPAATAAGLERGQRVALRIDADAARWYPAEEAS